MGIKKNSKLSAKKLKNAKKIMQRTPAIGRVSRIQQQIQTDLSPKFTEMKTGGRISRFGRPQTETKNDGSIPTEIAKFIPKHSPKRLKPKDIELELSEPQEKHQEETPVKINKIAQPAPEIDEPDEEQSSIDLEPPRTDAPEDTLKEPEEKVAEGKETSESQKLKPEAQDPVKSDEVQSAPEESSINVYGTDSGKETCETHQDDDSDASMSEKGKHDFSDTDSALGSTVSGPDAMDQAFFAGQLVWGSFATRSWYPCIIFPYDEEGNIIKITGNHTRQIHVKYFNWKGFEAFLPVKNVFEFKDMDDFWEQIKARGLKKSKVAPFSVTCYKAMEEANFFKQYAAVERTKIFEDVVKYKSRNSVEFKGESSTPESADRKSVEDRLNVDSAHESSASPTPSSPQYDPTKQSDPIACYVQAMQRYESIHNNNNDAVRPKRNNRQSVTSSDVAAIKSETTEKEKEDTNRRRSSRPIKKRMFEDFEQDTKSGIDLAVLSKESPLVEPKVKRAKVAKDKEEDKTLEERFVISPELLKHDFRTSRKKRVCMECLEYDGATYRCSGNGSLKCSGWFHESCSGHFESKREEIRHQCGDSDHIIQTQAMKTILMCKMCYASQRNCFVCAKPVDLDDEQEGQTCPNQDCGLAFHSHCLKLWPQSKMGKGNNRRSNQCPQHLCHTCFSKDIHNTGALVKCMKCPAAYHLQFNCVPAGTQILSQTQIICPRHPTEKELSKNSKDTKPLNVDYCVICSENGNLICCETCPNSFHTDCINNEDTDDNYYCQECQEGRLPLYYTIVWARVGPYRWWPGLIMTDNVVPEVTMKQRKYEREFCLRFFGTNDFFWTTSERVFSYDGSNISVKCGSSRLDSAFSVALDEARQFAAFLDKSDPQSTKAKPKPYTKILQNRPVAPVKLKKMDEHTQEPCSCKETDPSPCGKDSDCINMHLKLECDKALCPAGAACQNQKIRNREGIELKVVKTSNRGFGAVAVKDVPEGTFVIEYVGELIDSAEFNKRMQEKLRNKEKEFYFLTVEADLYVDAEPAGNLARFINHSCDPNCISLKVKVDGNTRIGIFTKQAIKANTELTFDYQMVFVDNKKTACFCGAPNCSGLIGEKPKEEKKFLDKSAGVKKKLKRKSLKIVLPQSKKRRTLDDTIDPIDILLKKMPEKLARSSESTDGANTSSAAVHQELLEDETFETEKIRTDESESSMNRIEQASTKDASEVMPKVSGNIAGSSQRKRESSAGINQETASALAEEIETEKASTDRSKLSENLAGSFKSSQLESASTSSGKSESSAGEEKETNGTAENSPNSKSIDPFFQLLAETIENEAAEHAE